MKPAREHATNNSQTHLVTSETWERRALFRAEAWTRLFTFSDPIEVQLDFDSVKPGYQTIAQIESMESGEILFSVPFRTKEGRFGRIRSRIIPRNYAARIRMNAGSAQRLRFMAQTIWWILVPQSEG